MNADEVLLGKINKAVAAANEIERTVETAKAELVSRSRAVGFLLLEAKKRHPKVTDFEAFLKRVDGLKLSRAYDCMRIAGGRVTDQELREEARERKRKSRAKKKLPPQSPSLPKPGPTSVSVTSPHVTESSEISIEQRRAENARLDEPVVSHDQAASSAHEAAQGSAHCLAEFRAACRDLLPKITDYQDQIAALTFVQDTLKRLREEAKHKRRAA
jgi:hypothetical protein